MEQNTLTREGISARLHELADERYRTFHGGLCPGTENILGVRTPVLRSYARELLRTHSGGELLNIIGTDWYEEILLRGMVIGLDKSASWEDTWARTEQFVPLIDNWAVCDLFCGGLKMVKKHRTEVLERIQPYLTASEEFSVRFALVILLDYFVEADTLEAVFDAVRRVRHDGYYVRMAAAWLLSVCLVKQYEATVAFLQTAELDEWTYRKAIQKARESRRLTPERKRFLQQMK
ncbi:MAG: DNA alkylation repair protein [Butyricicoccaceae bacterium]